SAQRTARETGSTTAACRAGSSRMNFGRTAIEGHAAHQRSAGGCHSARLLIILEPRLTMRPIAKRLVLRRAAAAQRGMLRGQRAGFPSKFRATDYEKGSILHQMDTRRLRLIPVQSAM